MRVFIDPGHGGTDTGAVAPDGTHEKDINLRYGKRIAEELERMGHYALLTREDDSYPTLQERVDMANAWEADCYVSIHANSNSNEATHGLWVLHDDKTSPDGGVALAHSLFRALRHVEGITDDDFEEEVYPDRTGWTGNRDLKVLSDTKMPAVIVELGFLTNENDLARLLNGEVLDEVAVAIGRGLNNWAIDHISVDIDVPYQGYDLFVEDSPEHVRTVLEKPPIEVAKPEETTLQLLLRTLSSAWQLPEVRTLVKQLVKQVIQSAKIPSFMKMIAVWVLDRVL